MILAPIFNRIKSLFSKNTRLVSEIKSTEITRTKIHRSLETAYMKVKAYTISNNIDKVIK
jgi:hypothetical protein